MLTTSASSSQVRAGMGRPPRSGCVTAGRKRHRSSPVNTTQRGRVLPAGRGRRCRRLQPQLPSRRVVRSRPDRPATSTSPAPWAAPGLRVRAQSFSDHYSQATLFWESMSAPEQDHLVAAFSFELGKCLHEEVTDGVLANLANVSADLVARVAANLGTTAPDGTPATNIEPSPALSLVPSEPGPVAGRVIGIFAADGVDAAGLVAVRGPLERAGAVVVVIAAHGGTITSPDGPVEVTKSALTTQSVEYDAPHRGGRQWRRDAGAGSLSRRQPGRGLPSLQDHRRVGIWPRPPGRLLHPRRRPRRHHRRRPHAWFCDGGHRSGRLAPPLGPPAHPRPISHLLRAPTPADQRLRRGPAEQNRGCHHGRRVKHGRAHGRPRRLTIRRLR